MRNQHETKQVIFTVTSGRLRVTDPCYQREGYEHCTVILENALIGQWRGTAEICDNHVVSLYAEAVNASGDTKYWETHNTQIGVDSGQAGIWDDTSFPQDSERNDDEYNDENSFYRKVCEVTLNYNFGKINEGGIVSSSGYGDGAYGMSYATNNTNKVVAIQIEFICDDENDEESDDDIWGIDDSW